MLGLLYVVILTIFGDAICIFGFKRWPERLASAFLVGLVLATWITYLSAAIFPWPFDPLIGGNLIFFLTAAAVIFVVIRSKRPSDTESEPNLPQTDSDDEMSAVEGDKRPASRFGGVNWWDRGLIAFFLIFSAWLMMAVFGFDAENVRISYKVWTDFGANLGIVQSFAVGSNFPTEYPLFAGQSIQVHFLFWFQAGNLYFLGLHPVWGVNLLSILSLTSLLTLLVAIGEWLFGNRWVGRIGACLFFFHGTLSYIYNLGPFSGIGDAITKILGRTNYLVSGFPYYGEDWGFWTLNVYVNQRHMISAIGIMALALAFWAKDRTGGDVEAVSENERRTYEDISSIGTALRSRLAAYIFCGVLIGLMPMWNGPVFVAAFAIFGMILLFFPDRVYVAALLASSLIAAVPQLLFLRPEFSSGQPSYPMFFWGFNVQPPTIFNVLNYIWFTFGFKLVLMGIALLFVRKAQRLFFVSLFSVLAIGFLLKFNFLVLTNHKFLNIWLVFANLFAAYGAWRLWTSSKAGKAAAVLLVALVVPGGFVDLMPFRNDGALYTGYDKDPLAAWIQENTEKNAVFLSHKYEYHPILFSGRKLFNGYTYFTAPAGYPTDARDLIYNEMFSSTDPARLVTLLTENHVGYVAFDDMLRGDELKGKNNGNEKVYEAYFPLVFEDKKYGNMKIYKVPDSLSGIPSMPSPSPTPLPETPAGGAFVSGTGPGPGQLSRPRGIAVDGKGNIFVTDTGNVRIQKFDKDGKFLLAFGKAGEGEGELKEPNGIVLDDAGNIFVLDAVNGKLVQFDSDGVFIKEWRAPDPGLYGPRDIAIGPNKQFYMIDQGHTRIVRFDPATGASSSWGTIGSEEGQFIESTGIAIGGELVYVADSGNNRIQVFDLDGKFIRQWPVPSWSKYPWHYPDVAVDTQGKRVYVTSGLTAEVLAFDLEGNPVGGFKPEGGDQLNGPSSIVVSEANKTRLLVLNTDGAKVSIFELPTKTK